MDYADNFGFQWNRFDKTQLHPQSSEMLWRMTGWKPKDLDGLDILEVGSGAGRFSRVLLEETNANVYSFDMSSAVEVNRRNNGDIAPDRFHLARGSLYELPFDKKFDKVFCRGVLQHTPDIPASIRALVDAAKPGGEIVVDFYRRRPWTKISAKYMLRPLTRRMKHDRLVRLIERNVDWMMKAHKGLTRLGLHSVTRFLPLVDLATLPRGLTPEHEREWAILDTFDMFSPRYDQPQRTRDVIKMFEAAGAYVTYWEGGLVRARRN